MKRLKVGVLDLITNTPREAWFDSRVMGPNYASIMPQCVGVWAEEHGHQVFYETFTGREDLLRGLPADLDVLFISCFSRASFLAYGLSEAARRRGTVTVLGGPHARSFPEHARGYFDYVCQLTDKPLVEGVLAECASHRPGVVLSAARQPKSLPSVRQRARYLDACLAKATRLFRAVPLLGSMGCPYRCDFCVDARIEYQTMPFDRLVDDLRFIHERYGNGTAAAWHDPNFGVRFKDYMAVIEESGTHLMHLAESSLSVLTEPHLKELRKARFVAALPGVESWYEFSNKGGLQKAKGLAKVRRVAEHLNLVQRYVPCVQANFVIGLDSDRGDEPWQLTKTLVDLAPGVFPGFSLLTHFQNSPLSERFMADGRTLAVPFPLLDNNFAINVTLKNYSPIEYYDRLIDLMEHAWSWRAIGRRLRNNRNVAVKAINFGRAVTEGWKRLKHYKDIRRRLAEDAGYLRFASGQSRLPPQFFFDAIRHQLAQYADLVPPELLTREGFVRSIEETAPAGRLAAHSISSSSPSESPSSTSA